MCWKYIMLPGTTRKVRDLAISSWANVIEIIAIGNEIKGHTFYADGNLFYEENLKSIKKEIEPI